MIVDLERFIIEERAYWSELEKILDGLDRDPHQRMSFVKIKRFQYLYQRTAGDLARIMGLSAETEIRLYLEALVGRAYAEVHEIRGVERGFSLKRWGLETFPRTFRRHIMAFWLALAVTLLGSVIGGMAVSIDPDAKAVILPFEHLLGSPSERVAQEEHAGAAKDRLQGKKSTFSAYLMTHNTRVAIFTFALGCTYGIGTLIMLFYNGVVLGAVCLDYIRSGESVFLAGWLLPHGAIEIPAILLASQAGLILAGALIGWGRRIALKERLRRIASDVVTLVAGLALMLVWAGIVEAFLSQYHAPVIPYGVKIAFGGVELATLVLYLGCAGRRSTGADRAKV